MIKDKKMKRVTLKVRGEQGWQVRAFEDESYVGILEQLKPYFFIENGTFEYLKEEDFDNWVKEKDKKDDLHSSWFYYIFDKDLTTEEKIKIVRKHFIPKDTNFLVFHDQYTFAFKIDNKNLTTKEVQAKYIIENCIYNVFSFHFESVFNLLKKQYSTSELIEELSGQSAFKSLLGRIKFERFERSRYKKIKADEEYSFSFEDENLTIDGLINRIEQQEGFKNFYKRLYLQYQEIYNEFKEEFFTHNRAVINNGGILD